MSDILKNLAEEQVKSRLGDEAGSVVDDALQGNLQGAATAALGALGLGGGQSSSNNSGAQNDNSSDDSSDDSDSSSDDSDDDSSSDDSDDSN